MKGRGVMKEFLLIIKSLASVPLILLDLAAFSVGIFCLYGGPDGNPLCAEAIIGGAAGIGGAAITALLTLAIWRFEKGLVLTSLILHEAVSFLFFVIMSIAMISSKEVSPIIAHFIVLLILVAGGYGIFKTAKAIKAEGGK